MQQIDLHGKRAAGRVALVDDQDYELVMQYRWRLLEKRSQGTHSTWKITSYARTRTSPEEGSRELLMHKLITGWPMTDHVNHDGLDNRRENLRPTDKSLNAANQRLRTDGASRYKGVYRRRDGLWIARVQKDGKRTYLGSFTEEDDAARIYNQVMKEIYGPHAHLNPVPEPQPQALKISQIDTVISAS